MLLKTVQPPLFTVVQNPYQTVPSVAMSPTIMGLTNTDVMATTMPENMKKSTGVSMAPPNRWNSAIPMRCLPATDFSVTATRPPSIVACTLLQICSAPVRLSAVIVDILHSTFLRRANSRETASSLREYSRLQHAMIRLAGGANATYSHLPYDQPRQQWGRKGQRFDERRIQS